MARTIQTKIEHIEDRSKDLRVILFKPLLVLLTKLHIRPNHISFLGLLASVGMFYLLIKDKVQSSLIMFFIYFFLDALDGTLARYQKCASDKGKFIDMTVDNIAATLLTLGLILTNTLTPINGTIFIYLMLINLIFAITIYNHFKKPNWFFHARGGVMAQGPKNLFFILFILWGLNIFDLLNPAVIVFNCFLSGLATINFFRILRYKL